MKKVGIIRCQQTEDMCPRTADFKVAKAGKLAFEEIGACEVVGFVTCGGCPGKRAIPRAKMMIERGVDVIAMASCIQKGNPISLCMSSF
jgi:predicted metal-binding protein